MSLFLGLDVSTTAAKCLLVNRQGGVVGKHSEPLSLSQPHPLWSEQDPEEWWDAMTMSIRKVLAGQAQGPVTAIGLTGQMHGLVILDSQGSVIRPAILWNDQRTGEQCDFIRDRLGRSRLIKLTGSDALTGFTAPKLLWVRQHEPEAYARIAQILLPMDYIRYRMTGEWATDLAGASGTLFMDIAERAWSREVLDALDVPASWMPRTHEGTEITGFVSQQASNQTGLLRGTPVVAGGGDQSAQAVGVGAISPQVFAVTVGTSGVVFAPQATYTYDERGRLHAFCHAVPGLWHLMTVMLSAAGSFQWYRDGLFPQTSYEELVHEAESAPAGAEGLVFLPYLTGERSPHADPLARGAFVGLTRRHTRAHLTRALLEGVCFGLRDCMELLWGHGIRPRELVASGGGMKSRLWRQILVDVLRSEVVTVSSDEGAAFGAAILAATGVGEFPSVADACHQTIQEIDRTPPGPDSEIYPGGYRRYKALYPALSPEFQRIGEANT